MGLNSKILLCLMLLPLALRAEVGKYLQSAFTIEAGLNSFSSSDQGQRGRNAGYSGRVELLQRIGIPIGITASLAYDLCPVCDNTGGEYVAAYSLVAQFVPAKYPFQILSGLGYATGNDPKENGSKGSFAGLNIPLIARVLFRFPFSNAYIAIGSEVSMELNNSNNVLAIGIPIQWGIW